MSDRAIARLVGVLFIVASATAIIGGTLLLPLDEPDYLQAVAASEAQIVSGVLLEMLLVLSVVGIAVMMFPVLRRRDETLALGYVGSRGLEAGLLLAAAVVPLLVLSLGQATGESSSQVGDALLIGRDWTYLLGSMVMLGVSALILYTALYLTKLVPRWLSVWGLLGGLLILTRGLLEMYGLDFSGLVQGLFAGPIALQEMVLAVWLIVKGFSSAATPISTPADVNRLVAESTT